MRSWKTNGGQGRARADPGHRQRDAAAALRFGGGAVILIVVIVPVFSPVLTTFALLLTGSERATAS
jgi:hypothetical protein